jgi:hypothetical protein
VVNRKDIMPSTNDHNALSPQRSLWLELHHDGRTQVFCFAPDEERAIVLGSLPRADIRVARPGISPVHFHFEREGDRIILVPTYNAEVRVNSMLVQGPVPIPKHALFEFSGIRIEAFVCSTPPERVDYPSLDILDRESGISYLAALPTDTQTTKLALDPFPRIDNLQAAIETRETPLELRADFSRTQRIERLAPELQTTQVMERLQIVTAAIPAPAQHTVRMERVAPEPFRAPAVEPTPVIEVRHLRPVPIVAVAAAEPDLSPPPPEIPSSPAGLGWQETTAFDLDGLKADLAPTPVPQPKAQAPGVAPRAPAHVQPPAMNETSSPPLTRSVRPPPSSKVSRAILGVGERAKAQPVAVGAMALGAAVALSLLMLGVSHLVSGLQRSTASQYPQIQASATTGSVATAAASTRLEAVRTEDAIPTSAGIASTPPSPPNTERGSAADNVLNAAAPSHLVAGRYVEARAAYAELGSKHPETPAYEAMSRLLDRRTSPACVSAEAAPYCPEIVR